MKKLGRVIHTRPGAHGILRLFIYLIFALSAAQYSLAVGGQSSAAANSSGESVANLPKFEVATVKPVQQSNYASIGLYVYPGGKIRIGQATLRMMIQYAYKVQDYQISGGPNWVGQDLYEVEAIPPDDSSSRQYRPQYINNPPTEEQRLMLQSLLSERFGLRVRHETKMVSGYFLAATKKTSQLVESKSKPAWPTFNPGGSSNGSGMSGEGVSMPYMASRLARFLGCPVVDKTGLKGDYDFQLPNPPAEEPPKNLIQAQDSMKKNIYDSLPDLGLKLKPAKISVGLIVIQQVNKPTAN